MEEETLKNFTNFFRTTPGDPENWGNGVVGPGRFVPVFQHSDSPTLQHILSRKCFRISLFKRFSAFLIIVLVIAWFAACSGRDDDSRLSVIIGQTMGTTFSVKFVPDDDRESRLPKAEIEARINKILKVVNQQMSTYISDSEISQFNQYRQTDWFPISSDFITVLEYALEISEKSNGAFDITVGPLVNLWGFGPERRDILIPAEEEIRERQSLTGYQKITVRSLPPAVKKDIPGMYCDLSSIAKGFGVDKVAGYLESLDIRNYLVEIGGELRARGTNAAGEIWQIGIATPTVEPGIQKILKIKDHSMATSGDYLNYFEKDGKRYSHTIDPRTGRPITHKLASVTVIHPSCTIADGLATAINVLGPQAGYQFAVEQELPAFMIVRESGGFVEKMTPQFERILNLQTGESIAHD